MKYMVGLKSEMDLLNEEEAKQRYLEMVAAGYKENDVVVAAPISVSSDVSFGAPQSQVRPDNNKPEQDLAPEEVFFNPS